MVPVAMLSGTLASTRVGDGRKQKISVTLRPETVQYKHGQYIDCRRHLNKYLHINIQHSQNMKNLFPVLASPEINALLPRYLNQLFASVSKNFE